MGDEDFNLDIPRIGYFIVYKGNSSFFSKQIEKAQKITGFDKVDSEYTHVEVSGGGKDSVGAVMPRSKIMDIIKVHGGRYVKIMKYVGYGNSETKDNRLRYKVGFFAAGESNLPYGWWALLWFKLSESFHKLKPWGTKKFPFCSLLAGWALCKVFPDAFDDYRKVMPAHFLSNSKFSLVWQGNLPKSLDEIKDE